MDFYMRECLKITDPTNEVLEWCNTTLTFTNPDFIKKEAMGLWTGGIEKIITLYEKAGNTLYLPFGVASDIYKKFSKNFNIAKSFIGDLRPRNYKSRIKTYDYQEKAIRAVINAKNGVLIAPCGSGKTQMGLEIASRIGGKTLWLTHTLDLLQQSMDRAKSCYDLYPNEYGTITGGKVNIGNTITFATVQTMSKIDLSKYTNEWDTIIVDECHKCIGTPTQMYMFYKVVSKLSARYKIGLTATAYRADGLEKCMFSLLGNTIYEISKSEVKDTTCPVKVKCIDTNYMPDLNLVLAGDGTLIYSGLINDLTLNKDRNNFIANKIKDLDGATLVLSDRVEHLTTIKNMCVNKRCEQLIASNSKAVKEQRKETLAKLNNGELDIVFATYKLAKEGLDVPNLRYLVLATPQKDKATVIQSCGRVGRKNDGKDYGVVVDFIDDFAMLKGYAKKRKGYYKQLGYEILI